MDKFNTILRNCIFIFLVVSLSAIFVSAQSLNETDSEYYINWSITNRSLTSDTYCKNNNCVMIAHSTPVNYFNGTEFESINPNITTEDCSYDYCVKKGLYEAEFNSSADSPWLVRVNNKDGYISYAPETLEFIGDNESEIISNIRNIKGHTSGNKISYNGIFGNGFNLSYNYGNIRLKEELSIDNLPIPKKDLGDNFSLALKFKLETKSDGKDNSIRKYIELFDKGTNQSMITENVWDKQDKFTSKRDRKNIEVGNPNVIEIDSGITQIVNEKNETLFYFSNIIAKDSNGTLITLEYNLVKENNDVFITLLVPYSWLNDPKRVYPVIIDPSTEIEVDEYGRIENDQSAGYYYNLDLYRIGGDPDDTNRGWSSFDVGSIADDVNITDVDLVYKVNSYITTDCQAEGNQIELEIRQVDYENQDMTPDTEAERQAVFNAIPSSGNYVTAINPVGSIDQDLGTGADDEVKSLIDGDPTPMFTVGFKLSNTDESPYDDCSVTLSTTSSELKSQIAYTEPDTIVPYTTATANYLDNNETYTFNTWTYRNVGVTLSCYDGASGCKTGYPKYCTDTTNTCTPSTSYSSQINITTEGTNYIRYYSEDNAGNNETTKNDIIKISTNYTQNTFMHVNDVEVWDHSDYFEGIEITNDFSQQLNSALDSCTADSDGYCNIPLIIHSDNRGKINVSDINIYFNITEYTWGVSNLPDLTTYKVRVSSTDGIENSTVDESNDDFSIGDVLKKFIVKNSTGEETAWFSTLGDIWIQGALETFSGYQPTANDEVVIRLGGKDVVIIDKETGNMYIDGNIVENQTTLTPSPTDNEFIIKDASGITTLYINNLGYIYMQGEVNSSSITGFKNKLVIKDNLGNNVARFSDDGNVILKGTLEENSNHQRTTDDEWIIRNNGEDVYILDKVDGNLSINGNLFENQVVLIPLASSTDFIIKDDLGNVAIYLNESGSLFLTGTLTQNGNP